MYTADGKTKDLTKKRVPGATKNKSSRPQASSAQVTDSSTHSVPRASTASLGDSRAYLTTDSEGLSILSSLASTVG